LQIFSENKSKEIHINVNACPYACLLYLAFVCVGNTLRAGILLLCFPSVLFSGVLGKQLLLSCEIKALVKISLVGYYQSLQIITATSKTLKPDKLLFLVIDIF